VDAQAIDIGESASPAATGSGWSKRRRLAALGFVAAAVLVQVIDAIDIAGKHALEVSLRPPPPLGAWFVHSAPDIARVGFNASGLAIVVALPALALVALLGRRAGISGKRVLATVALSMILIGLNEGRIQVFVRPIVGLPGPTGTNVSSVVLTPIVEELLQLIAVAIVLLTGRPRSGLRAGLVLGAAAGIGMTITETALYTQIGFLERGEPLYGDVIALRLALFGLNIHATTVALSGAALGAWLVRPTLARAWILVAGFAGAATIHGLWNLLASDLATAAVALVSPGPSGPELVTVFLLASTVSAIMLVVPWVVLAALWRHDARRAQPTTLPEPIPA
jgi:RsiW-degrading membrane proteinase PrsW (M82 family)